MTVAPQVEPLAVHSLADAVSVLRQRGLRLSTARRLVLEALFTADGPVSAERIARGLGIDPASVYRNLETLEHHGLVRHVHLGHGPGLYLLVGRGEREYLFCERCGSVRALNPEQLSAVRDRIRELTGYQARFTHFAIVGVCGACARHGSGAPGRGPAKRSGGIMSTPHGHEHTEPHSHEHVHADGTVHEHAHAGHDHEHVEHEHEHSHGDHVHSHPHVHAKGLEDEHDHGH